MEKRIKNLHKQFTDVTFRHSLAALIARFFRQGLSLLWKKKWKKKLMTFAAFWCLLSFSASASSNSFEITGYTIKNWIWKKKSNSQKETKGSARDESVYFFWWRLQKSQTMSVDARLLIFLYCVVVFNLTFCLLCWRRGFCMVGV